MKRKELKEYYKGYDDPENEGYLNAEIFVLGLRREELRHTPEDLKEVARIDEKLEYLLDIRSSASLPSSDESGDKK